MLSELGRSMLRPYKDNHAISSRLNFQGNLSRVGTPHTPVAIERVRKPLIASEL